MPRFPIVLIGLLLLISGCDSGSRSTALPSADPGLPPAATKDQIHDAQVEIEALDQEVAEMRSLPVDARKARELAFGARLERALAITINTKFENKNLYWLAYWRLTYADGKDCDQLLDRLDRLPSPSLKGMGGYLRVQLRLHQGRIRGARALADPLVLRMKEFSPLLDQVVFHESVGQPAPRIAGHNIGSQAGDPMAATEPWLLYLFVEQLDDSTAYLANSYRQVMATLVPPRQVRLVIVTFEGTALDPVARLRQLAGADTQIDLMWANPNNGGDAEQWRTRWKLPQPLPHVSLVGPDRSIMAVDLSPEALGRALSGHAGASPGASAPGAPAPAPAAAPGR